MLIDPVSFALLAVLVWVALMIRRDLAARRREAMIQSLLATFGAAQTQARQDPRLLLVWHPLAESARTLFPDAFAALDAATKDRFPFSKDVLDRAHAKWTTDWLSWEKAHDEEYRLKGAEAEQEIGRASGDGIALAKARLSRVQHEKVERYQQRYEEYIRTAKALQALIQ